MISTRTIQTREALLLRVRPFEDHLMWYAFCHRTRPLCHGHEHHHISSLPCYKREIKQAHRPASSRNAAMTIETQGVSRWFQKRLNAGRLDSSQLT